MQPNATKAKLKRGETVFGCFVRYPEPSLVEVLALQKWDFLVFDAEHGVVEPRDCENMTRAAELRGVTPIVRVTTNYPPIILRFMDAGVHGLLVPWINSRDEAERAVGAVKYYPRGIRGLAGVRASDYGQTTTLDMYTQQANAETLVVLQVETAQAVENLAEIIAVADVDVVFIGPTDLSHSLGLPGQVQHPRVQGAIDRIVDAVAQTDKALGIMVTNQEAAQKWQARGARFIAIGLESVLCPAIRSYLSAVRH
jgi:2-keto-3-deoxy-L-rhamnonate aldolase RhmA